MSKQFLKAVLVMAGCLPFCIGSSIGDATLCLEAVINVWRFTDENFTSGTYFNRVYHCVGTPINKNVILTSASCLQRFMFNMDTTSVYLYGSYNQTETIGRKSFQFFVDFSVNEMVSSDRYTPMIFNIDHVAYYNGSDKYDSKAPDAAFLVLKEPIYLNDGVKFVKLIDSDNRNNIDYSACAVVSRYQNRIYEVNATCYPSTDSFTYNNRLSCRLAGHPHGVRVVLNAGSPIFCFEKNSSDFVQVGIVNKFPYLHPPILFTKSPEFETVEGNNFFE